ncbi:Sm Like Protein [Gracilaria domingensis]|nr:Sm Like Protein [Gracilaria domingensis]
MDSTSSGTRMYLIVFPRMRTEGRFQNDEPSLEVRIASTSVSPFFSSIRMGQPVADFNKDSGSMLGMLVVGAARRRREGRPFLNSHFSQFVLFAQRGEPASNTQRIAQIDMSQLAALHARIQQLEADNASLASAAEQAAALAEEYAADAARYRHSQNHTEQRLHDEISDASRRKDRRIHRLSALLSEEKDRVQQLEQRVEQLEQLYDVSTQMETTLQASVTALQQQMERSSPSPQPVADAPFLLTTIRAQHVAVPLELLNSYFPEPDALGADIRAYQLFLRAHSIRAIATYARHHIPTPNPDPQQTLSSPQQTFAQSALHLFGKLVWLMRDLVAWCFEEADDVPFRAVKLHDATVTLEQRAANVFEQLFEMQQQHISTSCTPEYATMNTELLEMAMDAITDLLPSSPVHPTSAGNEDDLSMLIREAAIQRARTVRDGLINASRNAEASDQLESKLNAARTKLRQRESELDDIKVRLSVYEDRMTKARDDAKLVETLKTQVTELEEQIAKAVDRGIPSESVRNVAEANSITPTETRTTDADQAINSSKRRVATPLAQLQQVQDVIHVRRQLLHTYLSDIQSDTNISTQPQVDLESMLHTRDTLSHALNDLRTAAANASVVTLDEDTLKVKRSGKSMSQKILLQAMAASCSNEDTLKQWRIERERFCDSKILKMEVSNDEMASTLKLMRGAMSL